MITRRTLLAQGAAAALMPALPRFAVAELALGNATLTTVSDGHLELPGEFLLGHLPDEAKDIVAGYGMPTDQYRPECNVTLYRDGTNTVLFDVGSGQDFMSSAGDLLDSLDALDVAAEDVTHVVFTHAHPDHLWGLLDDFDDPIFTEAEYFMGSEEWDYWWNPETVNTIDEGRTVFAVGAKRRMEMIEDQIHQFKAGEEILPGIAAVGSFGHTPGHCSFEVRQGNSSAMLIGDAIGNPHLAFHRPDWVSSSDQDPETGIATRIALLDRLAAEKMAIVGYHLPNGGMGHVERKDSSFRFVQEG